MVEQLDKILLFIVIQLHKILLFIFIQSPQTSLFVKLVHHRRLVPNLNSTSVSNINDDNDDLGDFTLHG